MITIKIIPDELLGLPQKSTTEDDDKVCGIPDLALLHLRAQDHQLGRRMLDLQLTDDCRRIVSDEQLLQVVDDHLVHTVGTVAGLNSP